MLGPKLNEELIDKFSKEVEDGLPICFCCDLFGIHETTYYEWMKRAEQDMANDEDSIYVTLWKSIKKSHALFVKNTKIEMKNRLNGWQSLAWWLERTNPFFMPKQQIQADDDGKVTVVIGGKQKLQNPNK